ncbi:MAG TPA: AmmeMemoRadiSam system radical SAM enzyme, partial [archaeon]|nr:AmmeMemoRadiSam system radical SAM enzyme [archaeon]
WDISQRRKVEGLDATPESVVAMTKRYRCEGLAYTYNEPSIFIEFAHDIGVKARKAGLLNIFVSNGYDTPDGVGLMRDFLDCITVDFKGSGETGFVRKYITIANADPIFQTLLELRDKTQVHIEITDLIVPEVGDDLGAAKKLASWIHDNLGPDTPIHFLRFHPDYKMENLPPTPIGTLEKHHRIAKGVGLNYVYIGNVPGHPLEHTYCPECGAIAVERMGFDITGWNLDARNCCKSCGNEIAIVGKLSTSINEERFVPVII